MTKHTKDLLLLVLLISLIFLVACTKQLTPTETPPTQTTLAVSEAPQPITTATTTSAPPETTAAPIEPRWSSFLDYLVDTYFHKMSKNFNIVKANELIAALKATSKAPFIVDLRTPNEYANGHIQGAVNLSWGFDLPENVHLIPQDQVVYLYSHSSVITNQALIMMQIMGINAKAVEGNWSSLDELEASFANFVQQETQGLPENVFTIDEDIRQDLHTYFAVLEHKIGTDFENHTISVERVLDYVQDNPDTLTILLDQVSTNPIPGVDKTKIMKFNDHFAHELLKLDKEITYLIYSASPEKGGQALAAMRFMGFDALFIINQ